MLENTIKRGELYYAQLNPVIGSEQGGYRPVLIIQNDIGNYHSSTVIVAPITSTSNRKAKMPTHINIKATGALTEDSMVLLEQLRTIDKQRLVSYVGELNIDTMERINMAAGISIGIELKRSSYDEVANS